MASSVQRNSRLLDRASNQARGVPRTTIAVKLQMVVKMLSRSAGPTSG